MKTTTIIGAGAAGLMAAATILENSKGADYHIQIFEKNTSPGKKVIISGGGRCNVTTGIEDKKILLSKYTRGADFIKKAFGKFSPRKCREWFESHGVPMKCESDNRVFPISDDGTEVVEAFTHVFAKYRDKVTLHYGEGVSEVIKIDTRYQITTPKGAYESDIVVVTTGGNAYSHTGSTGDGYAFARSIGHSITQLGPSLSSFLTREKWTHELSGLAFEKARIENLEGPILLTHFGLSGPLAFMYSSQIAWEAINKTNPKTIQLSPLADMGVAEWDSFLKLEFANHPKKLITNILSEKLPRRFAELFVREYCPHIETTYPVSIARIDRAKIAELLGIGIPLTLTDRRPGDEFVTAGGVSTDEIDPETMESKIQKNLYFAGEVLNVDGYTGGFSLQICWASGYIVGRSIVENIKSA
ncbi:aminoacetone oxidase family FAD-binding enzyme [Candidatus Gracilibacteria bacterium]|nr:aminoacetone oxidase family FAD-binding enzyme [Candidatus Gracilibacteria bacterium]